MHQALDKSALFACAIPTMCNSTFGAFPQVVYNQCGGVAEWLNATVLKTVRPVRVSGVRIPPPPPHIEQNLCKAHLLTACYWRAAIFRGISTPEEPPECMRSLPRYRASCDTRFTSGRHRVAVIIFAGPLAFGSSPIACRGCPT